MLPKILKYYLAPARPLIACARTAIQNSISLQRNSSGIIITSLAPASSRGGLHSTQRRVSKTVLAPPSLCWSTAPTSSTTGLHAVRSCFNNFNSRHSSQQIRSRATSGGNGASMPAVRDSIVLNELEQELFNTLLAAAQRAPVPTTLRHVICKLSGCARGWQRGGSNV